MNSSAHSTQNPIVLEIKSRTKTFTTKSVVLHVNGNRDTLTLIVDDAKSIVPIQYHTTLWLLIHHMGLYRKAAITLQKYPDLHVALDMYTSIADYYYDVLSAFIQEVKGTWRPDDTKWRSAHLDYHFVMSMHGSAFIEPMQKATLTRINLTWDDFRNKKVYKAVQKLTLSSYHEDFCNGEDMCGVPGVSHDVSVDGMVSSIVKQARESLEKATQVAQAQESRIGSTSNTVKTTVAPIDSSTSESTSSDDDTDEAINIVDIKEDRSCSQTNRKGSIRAKATRVASKKLGEPIDMTPLSHKTQPDVHKARKNTKAGRRNVPRKLSPMEEDEIDDAANTFETKDHGRKTRKHRKGGSMADRQLRKAGSNRAPKDTTRKAKRDVMVIADDEDVDGDVIIKSPIAMRPQSPARKATEKGKAKAIVPSNVEYESSDADSPINEDIGRDATDELAARVVDAPPPAETNQRIQQVDDEPHVDLPEAMPEQDLRHLEHIDFPSAFEDWEEWNHTAFNKGNSQIFLKLGTWILLRFRQLTKTPIRGLVEKLLIPNHPASFETENEADFKEALGMTRLYSALAHVDTYPEYLAHLFHELGKASCEGRLECSHPGVRPLPEPPIPVLSMMAHEHLEWLKVLPFEDHVHLQDIDAEGEVDDAGGDDSIAMALDGMMISSAQESTELFDADDLPKRKRTLSKALSPPKAEGGRGFPKRSRASQGEAFLRPSSPVVKSNSAPLRTKSVTNQQRSLIMPRVGADELTSGSGTSSWTESEEESRMQMVFHSECNKVAEHIQDSNEDTAGHRKVSMDNTDVWNIAHSVETADMEPREGTRVSVAIDQLPASRTAALDEDEWFWTM